MTATGTRRYAAASFPPPLAGRLRSALAGEHARRPFRPHEVRDAAHRVADVAGQLDLPVVLVRGGLDVGGAELDHLWAVVDGRVIDVVLPVRSASFRGILRAYVAGDLDADDLDHAAHGYAIGWRVLGSFPRSCRYVGTPVFGSSSDAAASAR